jgi:hypothetical protein
MTTRFVNGLTTAKKTQPLGEFILPDVTKAHIYFNDFDNYTAADWTITTTEYGLGDATEALADEDGGVLLITNDDADDDADFFNKVGESFKFESGKKLWFEARFKTSDATQTDIVMGLQVTDTAPLDVDDGVFFQKDDGDANIDFHVEKNDTATSATAITTLADDTFIRLSFYYNGDDKIFYYADGVALGSSVTTNLPDDTELTISFGIQNGAAAAKTLSVDYILAAKER